MAILPYIDGGKMNLSTRLSIGVILVIPINLPYVIMM